MTSLTKYGHMGISGQLHHQGDPVPLFTFCCGALGEVIRHESAARCPTCPSVGKFFFSAVIVQVYFFTVYFYFV